MLLRKSHLYPASDTLELPRERLLESAARSTLFARMIRHIEVQHTAAIMRQDDENKQYPEGRRRHSEKIHRGHLLPVICQESPPGLRRRLPPLAQILAHGRWGDLDSQLEQFTVNARRSPQAICPDGPGPYGRGTPLAFRGKIGLFWFLANRLLSIACGGVP